MALGAVDVSPCARNGPRGVGHISVTFNSDGTVQSAVVDAGPLSDPVTSDCVAHAFRQACVPPFGGGPVRIGKSSPYGRPAPPPKELTVW